AAARGGPEAHAAARRKGDAGPSGEEPSEGGVVIGADPDLEMGSRGEGRQCLDPGVPRAPLGAEGGAVLQHAESEVRACDALLILGFALDAGPDPETEPGCSAPIATQGDALPLEHGIPGAGESETGRVGGRILLVPRGRAEAVTPSLERD